jgi:hypothetical protein
MTKAQRKEMLGEIRKRLFNLIEKDMAEIYFKLQEDELLNELERIKVITEDEFCDVVDSAFMNLAHFVSENPDHYRK